MAKSAVIILASALCFLSLLNFALCDPHFFVDGKVYCDTCRTQFVTRVSEYMPDAKVRLECRNHEGGDLTYSIEGLTDATGSYRLPVEGDHEEEVCEVVLVKSSNPQCAEITNGAFTRKCARISLTSNNGVVSDTRHANPLGFLIKEPVAHCPQVLKELGILPTSLF